VHNELNPDTDSLSSFGACGILAVYGEGGRKAFRIPGL